MIHSDTNVETFGSRRGNLSKRLIVQSFLSTRTVKAGEEELFKARAREDGEIKLIDLISALLDAKTDSYIATLPSLRLNDVRISPEMVKEHERMLTGGFYAEITLTYDAAIAQEIKGKPFGIIALREIQLSKRNVIDILAKARKRFTTNEWVSLLLRSIGFDQDKLSPRERNAMLLRMVPFVERNYNLVELGPRGTGKSHLFQQISPYAHLISGGKATVARMFVNNATGQRGLVCQYDVVCFDEVSGISFDQKDGVNIMKGYMESGEFSRGKESIRADGSIVMVGNFDVDVEHQQRIGHLFGPLPLEMRNDTAFMDRIHAYLPGWDVPKIHKELLTDHFGLVSDFLSECWSQLRYQSRIHCLQSRVFYGGALSGRDTNAVNKTVKCLLVAGWCLGIDFRCGDKQDGVCDDLCGGVFDSVFFVGVITDSAFDIDRRAFAQKFGAVVGCFVKDGDVVPVGLFVVAIAGICCQCECADRLAGLCDFALGIASQTTDEHDFVEHGLTSQVMFDGCFCLNPSALMTVIFLTPRCLSSSKIPSHSFALSVSLIQKPNTSLTPFSSRAIAT